MTPRAVTLYELEVIPISDPQARMGQEGKKRFGPSASDQITLRSLEITSFYACAEVRNQTQRFLNMLIFRAFVSHGKLTLETAS